MAQTSQAQLQQLNAVARAMIRARAIKMTLPIFSSAFTASGTQELATTQPQVIIPPRNAGLIKGFWVQLIATITNSSGVNVQLTDFGPANLISQFVFNDLNNLTRIQTTGWHMHLVNTVKSRQPFGAALQHGTGLDAPVNYGSNWQVIVAPPTIASGGGVGTVTMWYYVPLSYSEDDLRGAVYANVVNATMQLILSFNPVTTVASGADSTSAVYQGQVAGSVATCRMSACTVNAWQVFMDQLPVGQNGGVLLPILDLATIYELKNSLFTAIAPNVEFPMQYSNFRDFISTFAIYVNTQSTGARATGADINYWALQSANATNIFKKPPALVALENARQAIQVDFPPGTYYFPSRNKPISTVQYGNMQLILNALTANAGAYVLAGFEDFALAQQLSMAGSLAAS